MTDWTTPTHVVNGTDLDAVKFNTETVDNLAFLHEAKAGIMSRGASLTVAPLTWTSILWDTAFIETIPMWAASPYPERICPGLAGLWLATVAVEWPAGTDVVRTRLQRNGVDQIAADTREQLSGYSIRTAMTCQALLDGVGNYLNVHVYHNGASPITLSGLMQISLTWLKA